MAENNGVLLNIESKSVHLHLGFLQDVISRLSLKSSTCKNWCITLTSAFMLLSIRMLDGEKYILFSYVPLILFLILNVYYVYLENLFRYHYDNFINKLHSGNIKEDDLFYLNGNNSEFNLICFLKAIKSPSIFVFYIPLIIIDVFMTFYIVKP